MKKEIIMNTPMDVHLSILRHVNTTVRTLPYFAYIVVGRRPYPTPENTEEVYWCCASGRNFFSCVATLRERALLWARTQRKVDITGVTDEESFPVLVNTGDVQIAIQPLTFNDWILEPHLS
ncbi:MAG: hypothetical protein NUV54_02405 [Candidatus Taylorbacteria bacterium]|nr:hypothetical protein [Candidatus Taylorbacteria bacterium]